jgi:hypothetical protein
VYAAWAALPQDSVRSEPLKASTHHNAGEVFHGAYCRTLLLIEDGVFEVVPGICPVLGLGHFGKRRHGREVQATSGGASDLHKPDVPTRGTPRRTKAVMPPPPHH